MSHGLNEADMRKIAREAAIDMQLAGDMQLILQTADQLGVEVDDLMPILRLAYVQGQMDARMDPLHNIADTIGAMTTW